MTATIAATGALERSLALLADDVRARVDVPRDAPAGYLDLIGDDAPASTGVTQDLMLSSVVPVVYERWWRPALGRIAKGLFGPDMAGEHELARLLLELRTGDGVLDIACGPGNFSRDFARCVGPAGLSVGIDASPTMLARAIEDTDPDAVAYVRGDAVALPFRDAGFDAVCCFAALHLFADPFDALTHMARVLTPGGRIAIFTSCRLRSAPLRFWDGFAGRGSGMRLFERDEVTEGLAERGFEDIRQHVSGLTQFVGARKAA